MGSPNKQLNHKLFDLLVITQVLATVLLSYYVPAVIHHSVAIVINYFISAFHALRL